MNPLLLDVLVKSSALLAAAGLVDLVLRRRGSAACARESATVFGSRRNSRSVVVCSDTRSNCAMACGTPSSRTSTSPCCRSATGSPLRVG